MWKTVSSVSFLLLVIVGGVAYYYHGDQALVENAVVLVNSAEIDSLPMLEEQYALATAKAEGVRSTKLRERTLASIRATYEQKREVFERTEELRLQALSLMQREYQDLSTLRQNRAKAEEIIGQIQLASEAANLLGAVGTLFEHQKKTISERIAEEERRRAEEERRKAEEARMRAEEATRQAELERKRATEATRRAEAEASRRRASEQAAEQAARRREPTDCCCKTKVDKGVFLTKWVFEYKRLSKGKCTNPGFWDSHAEGWCVPDSYCH